MKRLKFIDLFAGIGGFHLALDNLGMECVFASEINEDAKSVYVKNFDIKPHGDITNISVNEIPEHDFLTAGFPCQPFSKGGKRQGFEDTRGTLFYDIVRILKHHRPKYILLENVRNLASHDNGNTYKVITTELKKLGYIIPDKPLILSPHKIGIPALRERVFIPGIHDSYFNKEALDLKINSEKSKKELEIYSVIDKKRKPNKYYIDDYEKRILKMWNEFYRNVDLDVIGFPVWYEHFKNSENLTKLPKWKRNIIIKNKNLYSRNLKFIKQWEKKYNYLNWCNPTHRKFEWQAGKDCSNIYEGLIQFRPSGVRVKRPDYFSTLVAMNHPQIIGKYQRRLTPDETKRLQSFPESYILHENENIALKQLGNAVNVKIVEKIVKEMFNLEGGIIEKSRASNY
jgi:DNA (cytosine-5)-methyltransferase 1